MDCDVAVLAHVSSLGLQGIDGYRIDVQVDLAKGLPAFDTVGLPGQAVKESRERVRAALKNIQMPLPPLRITCNMAPADTKKEGPIYDLPIAVGILSARGEITGTEDFAFIGELALDGRITPINGVLPMVIAAKKLGIGSMMLPQGNANEARFVGGIDVYPVSSLDQVVRFFEGTQKIEPLRPVAFDTLHPPTKDYVDFAQIKGQHAAKRALEIAAAGGHNILFIGPPGSGKTMLARSMPSILPQLSFEESLEVTKIHSISGKLSGDGIVYERPFRAPHHGVSTAALIGGGVGAKPGEISLAHNGVLFLDEFPEFARPTIESLRQPLEDGFVTVSRVSASYTYPSGFALIVSMNPCPCGNYGSDKPCRCNQNQIQKYLSKISAPILDRLDLHVEMGSITYQEITVDSSCEEPSGEVQKRVNHARRVQYARNGQGIANGRMDAKTLQTNIKLDQETQQTMEMAFAKLGLSARSYYRILKIARTIADLDGKQEIGKQHILEALQYRGIEQKYWNR